MVDENDVSVAQKLGELVGKMSVFQTTLSAHANDSKTSRAKMYDAIRNQDQQIVLLKKTVGDLEAEMKKASGSISDFEKIRNQADGARRTLMFLAAFGGTSVIALIGYFSNFILKKIGG